MLDYWILFIGLRFYLIHIDFCLLVDMVWPTVYQAFTMQEVKIIYLGNRNIQLITLGALGKVLVLESNSVAFIDVIRRLLCSNKNPISIFTQDLRVGIYLFVLGFLLPRTKGP